MPIKSLSSTTRILITLASIPALLLTGCGQILPVSLIERVFPADGEIQSAYGQVGISFKEPMDEASVAEAFAITPKVDGDIKWEGNQFRFLPLYAYDPEQPYTARLFGELRTAAGKSLSVDQTWDFTIRQPELLYFQPGDFGGDLWLLDLSEGEPQQLTQTNGSVMDFAPERTGERIAYTVQNESGGSDLWLMDRSGENAQILLNCGPDVCSEPDWSVDGGVIAYTREVYLPENSGFQPGQVWTVMPATGETARLYQNDAAFGFSPSFSPNGKYLASYDTTQEGIRILELATSEVSLLPRVLVGSGDWSADGGRLIFTDVVPAENEPDVVVYLADLTEQSIDAIFGETDTDTDFSQPRWSPEGEWLAAGLRPVNANVSKALWALRLDGGDRILIADDPPATFSAYQWDPWGQRLVYQRYELTQPASSIWLWDWESGESVLLAENAARPVWLP